MYGMIREMSKNLDFTVLATVKKCTDTPLALTIKMLIIAEIVEIVDDVYKKYCYNRFE